MFRILKLAALMVLVTAAVFAASCGQKTGQGSATGGTEAASTAATAAAPAPAGAWTPPNGDYAALDQGPRAAATPVDAALAARGKVLFGNASAPGKACFTCHAFDKKIIGPPLGPVAGQRTAAWMQAQIQHPDVMTQNDPVSRQLLAEYNKTQMVVPPPAPTDDEARALIEFIKSGGK